MLIRIKSVVFIMVISLLLISILESDAEMSTNYKGKTYVSQQVGQMIGYRLIEKDGKSTKIEIPISLWQSIPFDVAVRFDDYKKYALSRELTIKIEDADSPGLSQVILPTKDSIIPFWLELSSDGNLKQEVLVCATNVIWKFEREGIRLCLFQLKKKGETIGFPCYVSKKKGATIRFTKEGVVLDGVEELIGAPKKK